MFALRAGRQRGPGADRARQPPRHAADRRQVRRQPGRARRARGPAHAGGGRLRDQRAVRGGELDQRGGRALRPGHAGLGRVRRRLQPGARPTPLPTSRACASATALDGIGWRGEAKAGAMPLSAYLELHIEQGPILEAEDKTIGVVTGVQGVRWYEAAITGRESHAGTTPMPRRADAMVALRPPRARGAEDRAGACADRGRHRRPRRGGAELAQRHPGRGAHDGRSAPPRRRRRWQAMEAELLRRHRARSRREDKVADRDQEAARSRRRSASIPTASRRCARAPRRWGYAHRDIISGAGHDAVHLSQHHADGHDLRALQGRPEPQRGRERHAASTAPPAPRCCWRRRWRWMRSWAGGSHPQPIPTLPQGRGVAPAWSRIEPLPGPRLARAARAGRRRARAGGRGGRARTPSRAA